MLTNALPFALGVLLASASAPDSGTARRAAFDAEDVLAKTRAAYAALTSYAGEVSRRKTTLKHQANPRLEPAQFRFAVPAS